MSGKAKKSPRPVIDGYNPYLRRNRVVFTLNDKEFEVLNRLYAKYKVRNRSKFIRETVMNAVIKRMTEDYPSLFD